MPEKSLNKLKALRTEHSLNQSDLAELLDIGLTTYQRKESGSTDFYLMEAKKIADYFGLSIEKVFFAN